MAPKSEDAPNVTGQAAFTGTGLTSLLSDSGTVLAARLAVVGLGLGFVVVATRTLGPAGYGVFAYLLLTSTLVMTVASGWTTTAVLRYGRERFERDGKMSSITWARAAIVAPLLALAAVGLIGGQAVGLLPLELSAGVVGVALALGAGLILQEHQVAALQTIGKMKLSAATMVGQQAVALAALVAFAAYAEPTALGLGGLLAAVTLVSGLTVVPWLWTTALAPVRTHRAVVRRVVSFSTPMAAFTFSQFVMRSADLVVLGVFSTAGTVGVYAVAYQAYTALQTVVGSVTPVLTPLFVSLREHGREDFVRGYFETMLPQMALLAGVGCLVLTPAGMAAVPAVFGEPFRAAAVPLAVLLLGLALTAAASLLAPILILHEQTRAVAVINGLAAGVNVVLDIVLIGVFELDLTGAAAATAVSACIVVAGYARQSRRCLGSTRGPRLYLVVPAVIGITVSASLPGALGWSLGVGSGLLAAAGIVLVIRPFIAPQAELMDSLQPSGPVGRAAVRSLSHLVR